MLRDHDQVADTQPDTAMTPWADILLARLIGLDRLDDQGPEC